MHNFSRGKFARGFAMSAQRLNRRYYYMLQHQMYSVLYDITLCHVIVTIVLSYMILQYITCIHRTSVQSAAEAVIRNKLCRGPASVFLLTATRPCQSMYSCCRYTSVTAIRRLQSVSAQKSQPSPDAGSGGDRSGPALKSPVTVRPISVLTLWISEGLTQA